MAADLTAPPDAVDLALLRVLLADGSLSAKEAGERCGLSQPAAWRRIRRLEETGVIRRRRFALDRAKLGYGVTVFLGVKLAARGRSRVEEFERAVTAIPEVQIVQHVLGVYDYRLRVVARDLADFERILRRRIMTLPGIGEFECNVLLSEEKSTPPPI
ncbi:MAG: Lrp/AsnC family transcriptional regulator [Paracoccaceae bacterium]